jgi:hypothetical protein
MIKYLKISTEFLLVAIGCAIARYYFSPARALGYLIYYVPLVILFSILLELIFAKIDPSGKKSRGFRQLIFIVGILAIASYIP